MIDGTPKREVKEFNLFSGSRGTTKRIIHTGSWMVSRVSESNTERPRGCGILGIHHIPRGVSFLPHFLNVKAVVEIP